MESLVDRFITNTKFDLEENDSPLSSIAFFKLFLNLSRSIGLISALILDSFIFIEKSL